MKMLDNDMHKAEAQEKWGNTEAYKAYEAKTQNYSQQKWNAIAEGMDQRMAEFAMCMRLGNAPDSAQAQGLVKRLQDDITQHYYPCTNEILAGLGQMYVADERFRNNIDKHAEGTASFIGKAITAYCAK